MREKVWADFSRPFEYFDEPLEIVNAAYIDPRCTDSFIHSDLLGRTFHMVIDCFAIEPC